MVAVAVEDLSDGLRKDIGRIRLKRIPDGSAATLNDFVEKHVVAGSLVRTDGWKGYCQLRERDYHHEVVLGKKPGEPGERPLICHLTISLFKRLLLGDYQGAIHHD
jgi:hypothetical protein